MSAKKIYEYDEGVRAKDTFENGMKALFQVPKDAVADKKKPAKKRAKRSTSRRVASRDSEADAQTS